MASAASLSEPQVLAHAERCFPDPEEATTEAVADMQFAQETWLPGRPVPDADRSRVLDADGELNADDLTDRGVTVYHSR